jgi:hypothetical protein
MRRAIASLLVFTLVSAPAWPQEPSPEQQAADGIRQVQEGDFETAVVTLDSAVRRLEGQPQRERLLIQTLLQLGVALVALDQGEAARSRFRRALIIDPKLRLSPDVFSPKVILVFEQTRAELERQHGDGGKGGGSKALVVVGVAAAAAAVGVALASGGDDGGPPPVTATAANARFASPSTICPDGSNDSPLQVILLVDVTATDEAFVIGQALVEMRIVASPDLPAEVGFLSNRSATPTPDRVLPGTTATIRVDTTLLCGNGPGGPARFNEWQARVTLRNAQGGSVSATTVPPNFRVDLP